MLLDHGVIPIVVFDGDKLPAKEKTEAHRQRHAPSMCIVSQILLPCIKGQALHKIGTLHSHVLKIPCHVSLIDKSTCLLLQMYQLLRYHHIKSHSHCAYDHVSYGIRLISCRLHTKHGFLVCTNLSQHVS